MSLITYQIEDNNNTLVILKDGRETLCSIDIHYCDTDGYFIDEDFTPREYKIFGVGTLDKIKIDSMEQLNN